jgi:peroxiredoxin
MAEPLKAGDRVADFALRDADGREYSSADARRKGLLMFVFWKRTCGTCQYAFPYFQRFHEQYAGDLFRIWGIAQENAEDTRDFAADYGATFPQLLDTALDITEQYDLTSVPSLYLTDASGMILRFAPAFMADEYNSLAQLIAERTGVPYVPIVRNSDNAPALKPG